MPSSLNIYLLEPFYTGSHKLWADNLMRYSQHRIRLFSMAGRFWKWRMKGSALHLSAEVNKAPRPDVLLISGMIDLPLFRSLYNYKDVPIILYIHENQFAYPDRAEEDFTYAFLNYTSCLTANAVWWNSEYNRDSFLDGAGRLFERMPDYTETTSLDEIVTKSKIIFPGIPLESRPEIRPNESDIPVILWNHRWEHDKGPKEFFETLFKLKEEGVEYRLIVLGESYRESPLIFADARERLAEHILHWGYVVSREKYLGFLQMADVIPVTSLHDFFGISVWEAVLHGVYPLLPDKLSYPEIIPPELQEVHLYRPGEYYDRLKQILLEPPGRMKGEFIRVLRDLIIPNYVKTYDAAFVEVLDSYGLR